MNISYNWLKRYIALPDDAETVAKILTSIGLEVGTVEKVETIRGGLKGLVIGEVLTCVPHPNSDHLHLTTVNIGEGEPLPIVCGAPNVAAGQKVVVVEDLISTAGSCLEVVEVLREAGAEVLGIVSIFTYGMQKGLDRIAAAKTENHSLSNLDVLAEVAVKEGYITEAEKAELIQFRNNL